MKKQLRFNSMGYWHNSAKVSARSEKLHSLCLFCFLFVSSCCLVLFGDITSYSHLLKTQDHHSSYVHFQLLLFCLFWLDPRLIQDDLLKFDFYFCTSGDDKTYLKASVTQCYQTYLQFPMRKRTRSISKQLITDRFWQYAKRSSTFGKRWPWNERNKNTVS